MDIGNKKLRLNIIEDITKLNITNNKPNDETKKVSRLNIIDETITPSRLKIVDENISKLNIIDDNKPLNINDKNLVKKHPSDHMCYVLKSVSNNKRIYVGYTVDFNRRLRQHNGEITGGAKKTEKARPWTPVCKIKGFYDKSSALRFEWRIQHSKKPRPNCISNISIILKNLINKGDGLLPWPDLTIEWI